MRRNAIEKFLKTWLRVLLNEQGQMSVFIALIFQVLFVFFAMVINIGLLVHDKINLQNAVDLGAYYAAERQAELMDEIAHTNYQIRQDYKLLAWRYRVLGTLGKIGCDAKNPTACGALNFYPDQSNLTPALRNNPAVSSPEQEWTWGKDGNGNNQPPSVCVANMAWDFMFDTGTKTYDSNNCKNSYGTFVPLIQVPTIFAPFIPGVIAAYSSSVAALGAQQNNCSASAAENWWFAIKIKRAYNLSIAIRKTMLMNLRANLVNAHMKDLTGQDVGQGVLQTIQKNLTAANFASFDSSYFQTLNGLTLGGCDGPSQVSPESGDSSAGGATISEIRTEPQLFFTYMDSACNNPQPMDIKLINQVAGMDAKVWNEVNIIDPGGALRTISTAGEPPPEDPSFSSLGYEKNPWCMAYVGVKARTMPRKPFAPFGQPVQLVARAFAQPFGGRIGPWDETAWPQGSPRSQSGTQVDPHTTARMISGVATPPCQNGVYDRCLPNFSRFPGDPLGLRGELGFVETNTVLKNYAGAPAGSPKLSLSYFSGGESIPTTGDPLAWNPANGANNYQNFWIRQAEITAVAPDLFDINYYSIDPQSYYNYYLVDTVNAFPQQAQINGQNIVRAPDLGARNQDPNIQGFNTAKQIGTAQAVTTASNSNNPLFYIVQHWQHLLTGWVPADNDNFFFNTGRFGQCFLPPTPGSETIIPGWCTVGGRVGYSVRIVSRDHLTGSWTDLGGSGISGPILNPPPTDGSF